MRDGTWIPGQRQRLRQLAPGTWDQALAGKLGNHDRQDDGPGHSVIEIAIYPEVIWLAARSPREHSTGHRPRPDAPVPSLSRVADPAVRRQE